MIIQSGCETDVDIVKLPEFQQKLVITSFISPSDTVSIIKVRSNQKLFGELNSEKPLGLLTGYISDGTEEVALDTAGNGLMLDHKKMKIKYGTTYKIKVSSESGLSAEASCTIPAKKDFGIKLDTFSILRMVPVELREQYGTTHRQLNLKVTFQDVPEEENFYRIASSGLVYNTNPATQKVFAMEISPMFEKEFLTDKGLDGQKIVAVTFGNYAYSFSPSRDSTLLKIFLYHTEKPYFLYHKSLSDYNDGDNPFAEATPVYSNITGGLGIFTSYTVDSLIVRFK